mmetsp:Transcript_87182/g.247503  ORF Transcript_87182/g.247503 Transcript_87182/m.247503 type:complete len:151 (+) Transcript_87182:1180-1632(+)
MVGAGLGAGNGTLDGWPGMTVGPDVGSALGSALGRKLGSGDGAGIGTAVGAGIGTVVGAGIGTVVGAGIGTCVGTYVPIELPVVTCHESVTPLDRAWTSVGTSPVNMLELRSNLPTIFVNLPICVGMVEENEFPFSLNRCVVVMDEDGDG